MDSAVVTDDSVVDDAVGVSFCEVLSSTTNVEGAEDIVELSAEESCKRVEGSCRLIVTLPLRL